VLSVWEILESCWVSKRIAPKTGRNGLFLGRTENNGCWRWCTRRHPRNVTESQPRLKPHNYCSNPLRNHSECYQNVTRMTPNLTPESTTFSNPRLGNLILRNRIYSVLFWMPEWHHGITRMSPVYRQGAVHTAYCPGYTAYCPCWQPCYPPTARVDSRVTRLLPVLHARYTRLLPVLHVRHTPVVYIARHTPVVYIARHTPGREAGIPRVRERRAYPRVRERYPAIYRTRPPGHTSTGLPGLPALSRRCRVHGPCPYCRPATLLLHLPHVPTRSFTGPTKGG